MALTTTTLQAKATTKRLATSLVESATTIWAICAKHTSRAAKNLRPKPNSSARARQLLITVSNKAARLKITNIKKVKKGKKKCEHGLWQKSILMGDKCEPLDFSGIIYYDNDGKQLQEIPVRSLQGSPLPGYLSNSVAKKRE